MLKKIITVTEANSAPNKPGLPFTTLIINTNKIAIIEAGRIAPFQSAVSLASFSLIMHQLFAYLF
jgi:hypothetical protein